MLRMIKNNSGVTLVEYGLIVVMIAVVVVVSLQAIGTDLTTVFTTISTKV